MGYKIVQILHGICYNEFVQKMLSFTDSICSVFSSSAAGCLCGGNKSRLRCGKRHL